MRRRGDMQPVIAVCGRTGRPDPESGLTLPGALAIIYKPRELLELVRESSGG